MNETSNTSLPPPDAQRLLGEQTATNPFKVAGTETVKCPAARVMGLELLIEVDAISTNCILGCAAVTPLPLMLTKGPEKENELSRTVKKLLV